MTTREVHYLKPDPPHCPYFAVVQLGTDVVEIGALDVLGGVLTGVVEDFEEVEDVGPVEDE